MGKVAGRPLAGGDRDTEQLLAAYQQGETLAFDELTRRVSPDFRRLVRKRLADEREGLSLAPSDVLQEVLLRLFNFRAMEWQSRSQLMAWAAEVVRRVLVDHARRKLALKRGERPRAVPVEDVEGALSDERERDLHRILAVHEALEELRGRNERQTRVVVLRFYGGLSLREVAHVLGVSPATVKTDWKRAKDWLYAQMK